jgi:AraC-like DNA-binding protein
VTPGNTGRDWASYWRSGSEPIEAMHAHFSGHAYHRHSHDSYSFGVTESGAQGFRCRGGSHVSTAGLVMAFNPDDPHDGHSASGGGFTYRMIHIGPGLLADTLADITGTARGLPLFTEPVIADPALAAGVRRLHAALTGPATPLARAEQLSQVTAVAASHASGRQQARPAVMTARDATAVAGRVRAFLRARYADPVTGDDLAAAGGCSRHAAYRAFRARYGLAPSEYQRGLRLRAARAALAQGVTAAEAAATTGFADQAHLTRWFRRWYGITPGAYQASEHRQLLPAAARTTGSDPLISGL